ncbi:MAG: T9SS type A sorting domain-containing protein [Saprospiraceae bacterium]|nr:T9SS type A sorting domain-containing protein [Saprospiraceae bacterium]
MKLFLFYPNSLSSFRATLATLLCTFLLNAPLQLWGQCPADAGGFSTQEICFQSTKITLKAVPKGDAVVPDSFQRVYLLSTGSDLVIQEVDTIPEFDIDLNPTGVYTIHTLIFNPSTLNLDSINLGVTTGVQVNALLVQGGGTICASLDVNGVKFRFGGCEDQGAPCNANAGTLTSVDTVCVDSIARLTATIATQPVIPDSFQVIYVLTSGQELVIQKVDTIPSFTVNAPGLYTIHTLVYDSATLDLSTIQLGVTTGLDVNALLVQGGGEICGALDVMGAIFNVLDCDCPVSGGTLMAEMEACLEDSTVTLTAVHGLDPVVPDSFQVAYILTSGDSLVIAQVNSSPTFVVDTIGLFTIHTLVYDSTTLSLDSIQFGVTTGADINALLTQGGGEICGALDIIGAAINVITNCTAACTADAGTLMGPSQSNCITEGQELIITATHDTEPVVPTGYKVGYLLTSGDSLVIVQIESEPSFTIDTTGIFTIHTLVYDSTTLNLDSIALGVTNAFDIDSLLIQGGGTICGDLDAEGARYNVNDCNCEIELGRLMYNGLNSVACTDDNNRRVVFLFARIAKQPNAPNGFKVAYVLTSGDSLVIEQIGPNPYFNVEGVGVYRIHILVYDPMTLDLSTIQLGVTTAHEVNGLLTQGGGEICGALEINGLRFMVKECTDEGVHTYPNPATRCVNLRLPHTDGINRISVQLVDMAGNIVKEWRFDGGAEIFASLEINDIIPGIYFLKVSYDGRLIEQRRIVKAG